MQHNLVALACCCSNKTVTSSLSNILQWPTALRPRKGPNKPTDLVPETRAYYNARNRYKLDFIVCIWGLHGSKQTVWFCIMTPFFCINLGCFAAAFSSESQTCDFGKFGSKSHVPNVWPLLPNARQHELRLLVTCLCPCMWFVYKLLHEPSIGI